MAHQPKWMLTIEDVRGTFLILVSRGKSVEGSASADDLSTALDMGRELYEDCQEFRGELPAAPPVAPPIEEK